MNVTERHGGRWWQPLADAWQGLRVRAEKAITRFAPQNRHDSDHPLKSEWTWAVLAADVREEDDCVVVQLEMPGMNEDEIHIDVVGDALRISGEKQHESSGRRGQYHVIERAYGRFERVLPLGVDVQASDARATYKQGVLTVTLPKRQQSNARVIPVKSL